MLFSEPTFLFFFLPAVLFAYFGLGKRWNDWVLTAFSLGFYAWGEHGYVVALLASILLNWSCALGVSGGRQQPRAKHIVTFAIVANLLMLGVFKYAGFVVQNVNALRGLFALAPLVVQPVHLPIGISFFAFQGMSYVIDVYRGEVAPQRSLLKLAMYKSFFPQLIAGPIVRYVDVAPQIENRSVDLDGFADGARRFVLGLGKKMIIANVAARAADGIFGLAPAQLDLPLSWIGIVAYTLQIYFDFSGYSDMAIGLGRMFGFRFLENFDYPYIATSLTDFWRRWHISLSTWFRDYLYIPLGGNRVSTALRYRNLMVVFLFCGLWHGASWNFALWGVFHGAFLVLERTRAADLVRLPFRPLHHAYVLLVVMVGWAFCSDTLPSALHYLGTMAALSHPTSVPPGVGMFVDKEVAFTACVGIVGATPILPWLKQVADRWKQRSPGTELTLEALQLTCLAATLLYAQMLMAAGSYSPFIYFRF